MPAGMGGEGGEQPRGGSAGAGGKAGAGGAGTIGNPANGVLMSPPGEFRELSMSRSHGCGIRFHDGSLQCWGSHSGAAPTGSFLSVSAHFSGSCALRDDGSPACWSRSGTPAERSRTRTGALTTIDAKYSDETNFYACGVREDDGTLECWGMIAR